MDSQWVIIANASLAHIYSTHPSVELVQTLTHENSRAKTSELVEDRTGHYQKGSAGRGAYSPPHMPKELEQMHFAKEIADLLEKNRNSHKFNHLIIVAAPHFHGLLMQHMHDPLKKIIAKVVEKDIVDNSEHELKKYIQEMLHV